MSHNFYGLNFDELSAHCEGAHHLFNWHYKQNRRDPCLHHNLPKRTRQKLLDLAFELPKVEKVQLSTDRTVKFLFRLHDDCFVESVLIPFHEKYTICLSSQVGCAMACVFCRTGMQGFKRNLQTHEIVGQLLEAKRWLTANRPEDCRLLNVVFMGQGEPLHNFDHVMKAAEIFVSQHGLSLADHKITISTSGFLPGLTKWIEKLPPYNLALSLHSLDEAKRSQLIPINRKYPLSEVMAVIDRVPLGRKRFVTYEYLLVKDFNDSDQEAEALGRFAHGRKAMFNLIPFNPFPGSTLDRPELDRIQAFKAVLDNHEVPNTIRTTKGDEILAACGQLNTAPARVIAAPYYPSVEP